MNIPTFLKFKWTEHDGQLTESASLFHDELNRAMQGALSDNGWTLPQVTAAELASIEANTPMADGAMWYETDANEMVVKINGALRKVTTTAYP